MRKEEGATEIEGEVHFFRGRDEATHEPTARGLAQVVGGPLGVIIGWIWRGALTPGDRETSAKSA